MRTPKEIYREYNIMPQLQLHQLRVAAVGKTVCGHFKEQVNTGDVVLACLFHDMGNILKFDLTYFPDSVQPEGLAYWEGIKNEYRKKYGDDQHEASKKIARELGLSKTVIDYIDKVRFSGLMETVKETALEPKIVEYGDCRVAPHGIVSIKERFLDGRKRYLNRFPNVAERDEHYEALTAAGYELERQLFEKADITPADISDSSVVATIEELWKYPIA